VIGEAVSPRQKISLKFWHDVSRSLILAGNRRFWMALMKSKDQKDQKDPKDPKDPQDRDVRAAGPRMGIARANSWARSHYRGLTPALGFAAILLALAVCLPFSPLRAAEAAGQNDLCLSCHGEKSMTTKRAGRTVSLFVDGKKFSASVHNSLSCTS